MAIVANGINISNCGVGIMSVGGGKVCAKDAKFNNCDIDAVIIEGKAYGYEFGWRRKDLNGTNLVTRIYFGKPIEKEG